MSSAAVVALAAAMLLVAADAQALTVSNRDTTDQRLEIRASGSAVPQNIVVKPQETLDGLCEAGCTIALESGAEEAFEGYEVLEVENGRFVIVE